MASTWKRQGAHFGIGGNGNGSIRLSRQFPGELLERTIIWLHVYEQYAVQQAPEPFPIFQSCIFGIFPTVVPATPGTTVNPVSSPQLEWILVSSLPPTIEVTGWTDTGEAFTGVSKWFTGPEGMESKSRRRPLLGDSVDWWLQFNTSDANGFDANFTFGTYYSMMLFST